VNRRLLLLVCACGAAACAAPLEDSPETRLDGRRFVDITDRAGVDEVHDPGATGEKWVPETMGAGVAVLDADGDGWMDLYLVQSGPLFGDRSRAPGNRLFRNRGDGTFADITEQAGVGDTGYGQGAVAADVNGDGAVDLYVANYGPNVLYVNNGDGTFTDVSAAAGVDDPRWSTSAAFFDADGDTDLDLYVANYVEFSLETHRVCGDPESGRVSYCHPDVYPSSPDALYVNRGDGTFTDATERAGIVDLDGKGLGVVAADLDNDGLTDLYVANDSTPNFLFANRGDGTFDEVGLYRGAAFNGAGQTQAGMGVDAGDVDGDGWLDLIVTHLSMEDNALYLGGPGGYRYGTGAAGLYGPSLPVLGFGCAFFDLDADGDLDLVVANGDVVDNIDQFRAGASWAQPDQVFVNDGAGRFDLLPPELAGDLSEPRVGRGLAVADVDNDGRQDLVVTHNRGRARLYRNAGGGGRWLGIALDGTGGNRAGIGARVHVRAGGMSTFREVRAGSSYASSNDPRLVFGLGEADGADVSVRWPNGDVTEHAGLEADRYHLLAHPDRR
jgi:hypothetical protein